MKTIVKRVKRYIGPDKDFRALKCDIARIKLNKEIRYTTFGLNLNRKQIEKLKWKEFVENPYNDDNFEIILPKKFKPNPVHS